MSRHATIDRSALAEALHYGVPVNRPSPPGLPFSADTLEAARARRVAGPPDKDALLDEGVQLWRDVCRRVADSASYPILLPFSAGLDSRAVLAGLCANDVTVHTVTYGLPGAFDYELAPRIAKCAGASNARMNLEGVEITREKLLDTATQAEHPSFVLDMFFNHRIAKRYGGDYSYINGFAGDAVGDTHLKTAKGFSWSEAKTAFAHWKQASRTVTLTDQDMDPVNALPAAPFVDPELLPSIQQLEYAFYEQRLTRPIVCPPGVEVLTPFLDSEWSTFLLGLPDELRESRAFLVEIYQRAYPELFSLPTSASYGLALGASDVAIQRHRKRLRRRRRLRARLQRVFPAISVPPADRRWQYLDFRGLLREEGVLADLFIDSMARLDERGVVPWIDAQGLLEAHRACQADHFKALNVLFNLELLLEARPELFAPSAHSPHDSPGYGSSAVRS